MTDSPVGCRACGEGGLTTVLDLGHTPLANALLTREQLTQPEPTFPLTLAFCGACSLLQITETVPPESLFSDYLYLSSFSDTMLTHARHLVERMIDERNLGPDHFVIEIASNDGYLLQYYRAHGIPVLGVEPAVNLALIAEQERGIPTLNAFFGRALASEIAAAGPRPDVIHAHNVLAHVADTNGFVAGIALLLDRRGVAVIEVPYVKDMVDHCEFDTIYHEHLCYFSLTAVERLARAHGLVVADVERVPIHGGSLRLHLMHHEAARPSAAVTALLAEEVAWGVNRPEFYRSFADRVDHLKQTLRCLLQSIKDRGERVAAYGASAKGSTLLNVFGIGAETIDFVVDRSTVKQGRYTPGTHLPIHAPEYLLETQPEHVLLLTWNFAEEILRQQEEYRRRGGHFIVPVPEPVVV
jgi:hypothetical protein